MRFTCSSNPHKSWNGDDEQISAVYHSTVVELIRRQKTHWNNQCFTYQNRIPNEGLSDEVNHLHINQPFGAVIKLFDWVAINSDESHDVCRSPNATSSVANINMETAGINARLLHCFRQPSDHSRTWMQPKNVTKNMPGMEGLSRSACIDANTC